MAAVEKLTTTVSTKGQVILPKAIRQRKHWEPGTRLVVEDTPDGVLLKAGAGFRADAAGGCRRNARFPRTAEDDGRDGRGHNGRSKAAPCSRSILMSSSVTRPATTPNSLQRRMG